MSYLIKTVSSSIADNVARPFTGVTHLPVFTDNGNGTFHIDDTGEINFSSSPTGDGIILNFNIPSASFTASITLDPQYVVANYNGGSPVYQLTTNQDLIDEPQVTSIFTITYSTLTSNLVEIDWDQGGILLANKMHKKAIEVEGTAVRLGTLKLGVSGSYYTIGSGSMWYGVKNVILGDVNTSDTASTPLETLYHSESINNWIRVPVSDGKFNNIFYDDGTSQQPLSSGSFVVNYIYRFIGLNDIKQIVSNQYNSFYSAQTDTPPVVPKFFHHFSTLVGRIIIQSGSNVPSLIDPSIGRIFGPPNILPDHDTLQNIQGGTGSQYYHLTQDEYTGTGNGVFVRQSGSFITGSISNATSASHADLSISTSYALTSSYVIGIQIGNVSASQFQGNPKEAQVTLFSSYTDLSYIITLTGQEPRAWAVTSKTTSSFVVSSNSNVAPTSFVYWRTEKL
jgi:hypothetical protein